MGESRSFEACPWEIGLFVCCFLSNCLSLYFPASKRGIALVYRMLNDKRKPIMVKFQL